jgi:hypothetical protein
VFQDYQFNMTKWKKFDNNMPIRTFYLDIKLFRVALKLKGLPPNSTYYIQTYLNTEITEAGVIDDYAESKECEEG